MQTIWGLVDIFQMKNEANGVIYSLLPFQIIEDSHFPPNLSKVDFTFPTLVSPRIKSVKHASKIKLIIFSTT